MKKIYLFLSLIVFVLSGIQNSQASHVMGGGITWTCVGQDSFIITLKVYRDCNGVAMSAASIPIRCATTGASITTLNLTTTSIIDITPTCLGSCTRCQSLSCSFPYGIEEHTYTKLVKLNNAGSCCKANLSYSMCCRNSSITTGAANSNLYFDAQLDRCISPCDNSPSFTNPPISIICIGQDFFFDQEIIDIDTHANGTKLDSLSFEWTPPLSGAGASIAYTGQYSYDKPIFFWGFPNANLPFPRGLHFDKVTCEITFRPMKIEQTIMAVKVVEWRMLNGSMTNIGEVRRDFQVIVISCPNNNAPVLGGSFYKEICAGDSAIFTIATNDYDTKDWLTIDWNKKFSKAKWITTNGQVKHPTAILKIPTDSTMVSSIPYIFKTTVTDDACYVHGSSTRAHQLLIKPPDTSNFTLGINKQYLGCGNYKFNVINASSTQTYRWTIIDEQLHSINGSEINFHFSGKGTHTIILEGGNPQKYASTQVVLQDSFIHVNLKDTAHVLPGSIATLNPDIHNVHGSFSFKWDDGDSTHFIRSFFYNTNQKTKQVSITVKDKNGCTYSDSCMLYYGYAQLDAGMDVFKCYNQAATLAASYFLLDNNLQVTAKQWFKYGDIHPISNSTSVTVVEAGDYTFKLSLSNGSYVQDYVHVSNTPIPVLDIGSDTTICSGIGLFPLDGLPVSPSSYWSGTAIEKYNADYYFNASHPGIKNGYTYLLQYHYIDSFGCTTSSGDKQVKVYYTLPKPELGNWLPFCVNENPYYFDPNKYPGVFSGKGIVNLRTFNPAIAGIGQHEIIYQIGDYICTQYDTTIITVVPIPEIEIRTSIGKTNFCKQYGSVELTAQPAGGSFYGNNVTGNYFNINNQVGSFPVYYTYADSNGCIGKDTLIIHSGDAWIKIVQTDTACINNGVQLRADFGFIDSSIWIKSIHADGYFANSASNPANIYYPGPQDLVKKKVFLLLKSIDSGCPEQWDSAFVAIHDTPFVFFYADKMQSTQNGEWEVQFHTKAVQYPPYHTGYEWDFGDGETSTNQSPLHRYKNPGIYTVSLQITNVEGCNGILKKQNYISIVSALEEMITQNRIVIIPNPAANETMIISEKPMIDVSVYNSLGKLILQENPGLNKFTLNSPGSGIYFIKITDINQQSYFRKVVFR